MKNAFLLAGICGLAAVIVVAGQTRGGGPGGRGGRIASALDANHDGTISSAELAAARGRGREGDRR